MVMVKYRLLSIDELKELEKEFIEYLILNGIAADDWVKIKDQAPEKADNIIALFSDVVFEKILRETQFLEWRGEKELKASHCLKDKFVVVALDESNLNDANLNDSDYLRDALIAPPSNLKVFTVDIPFELSREREIFKMTERGFQISKGKLFKTLCLALPQ